MRIVTTELSDFGPVLQVTIATSAARFRALQAVGAPIPLPQRIRALVDPGATCTLVDLQVIEQLHLDPKGTAKIHTSSTGDHPVDALRFDVSLWIDGPLMHNLSVVGMDFSRLSVDAFIGMDVLSTCVFTIDGPKDAVVLQYDFSAPLASQRVL